MADERTDLSGAVRARVASLLDLPRREMVALAMLGALALGGAGFAYVRARPLPPLEAAVAASPSASPSPEGVLVVHVVGAVRRPGVVELAPGSRVRDAVARAGGLTREADATAVNLARPVTDGEQILVPARGAQRSGGSAGAASGGAATSSGGKVNLNLASAADLEALPGIGPVLAERIVAYREQNGPFSSVRDLLKVPGIGQKKFSSLEPYITV